MAPVDEATLERLRENSRIRLDAEGRFWHEDALVEHPRVAQAFHRGLGRSPDGRPTLRVGPTWCYLQVDDTLYLARRAVCTARGDALSGCLLRLDDESEEPLRLRPGAVAVGAGGALYARVKGGQEWARLIPEAHRALGQFVEERGEALVLHTTEGDLPLGAR